MANLSQRDRIRNYLRDLIREKERELVDPQLREELQREANDKALTKLGLKRYHTRIEGLNAHIVDLEKDISATRRKIEAEREEMRVKMFGPSWQSAYGYDSRANQQINKDIRAVADDELKKLISKLPGGKEYLKLQIAHEKMNQTLDLATTPTRLRNAILTIAEEADLDLPEWV